MTQDELNQSKVDLLVDRANILRLTSKTAKVGDLFADEEKKTDPAKYTYGFTDYSKYFERHK